MPKIPKFGKALKPNIKPRTYRPTKSGSTTPDRMAIRRAVGGGSGTTPYPNKPDKMVNKPNGIKQIGDMIKNAARNPADYYAKNAPIKKGRTAGPAERVGRKYGTKAGRAIDRGVAAVTNSARSAAIRVKGRAMDLHGDLSNKKYSGYDMGKAAGIGAVGYGIGNYASSKWSEHKRSQRGY